MSSLSCITEALCVHLHPLAFQSSHMELDENRLPGGIQNHLHCRCTASVTEKFHFAIANLAWHRVRDYMPSGRFRRRRSCLSRPFGVPKMPPELGSPARFSYFSI